MFNNDCSVPQDINIRLPLFGDLVSLCISFRIISFVLGHPYVCPIACEATLKIIDQSLLSNQNNAKLNETLYEVLEQCFSYALPLEWRHNGRDGVYNH